MQDGPNPTEMIAAVTAFLRQDILPLLQGTPAFQLRIAANALDLVAREIAVPASEPAAVHDALRDLLGEDGDSDELTAELARRIAARTIDLQTPGLAALLWSITDAKLNVDQPKYAGYLRARALRAAENQKV